MKRFLYLNLLAGLSVVILLAACAQEGSGTSESFQMQESPYLRFFERKSGKIMYLGADGNLYLTTQVGGEPDALTTDANTNINNPEYHVYGRFAWAPDNEKIAYVSYTIHGPVLYIANKDGGDRFEVFSSNEDDPIFLYWAPDSSRIGYLTNYISPENYAIINMKFYSVEADGLKAPEVIREWQQPLNSWPQFFWIWDPIDPNRFFAHIAGIENSQLMMATSGNDREISWTLKPAIFQTPAWSPDGFSLMVAVTEDFGSNGSRNSLVITDLRGRIENRITDIEGATAFSWSPDGKQIAYISSDRHRGGALGFLTVAKSDNPDEDPLVIDDPYVFAHFWSPDSKRLAYFSQMIAEGDLTSGDAPGYSPSVSLNILDIKSGKHKNVLNFFPTPLFREILQFFDQYQNAVALWSPDSENIVISARTTDGESAVIVVVPASGNIEPRAIAEGSLAVWSPEE